MTYPACVDLLVVLAALLEVLEVGHGTGRAGDGQPVRECLSCEASCSIMGAVAGVVGP